MQDWRYNAVTCCVSLQSGAGAVSSGVASGRHAVCGVFLSGHSCRKHSAVPGSAHCGGHQIQPALPGTAFKWSLDWASWIVNRMSWALVVCFRARRSCRRLVWCCLIRPVLRRTSITRSWCSPAALELDAEDSPRRRSPSALQVQPSDGEDWWSGWSSSCGSSPLFLQVTVSEAVACVPVCRCFSLRTAGWLLF